MLHSYCHELPGRAPFFGGPAQSSRLQLALRLRPVAQPLISVAAFQPERSTAQRTTLPQQVSRPRQSAVVSLEPASTAVNNVQVLGGGVRSVPREPNVHKHRRRRRLRVAVDVDEVLGRFLHSLNKFCHEEYGLLYDIPDYSVYEFAKIWNCSTDESNHIVHDFFKSRHFAAGILPIPGALHSLQRLGQTCELVVVTSRQHCIQQPTLDWVDKHFPGIFSEVHFGNHWALEGTSKAKSEICRDIGATVLIDDNPRYAVECATAGIDVLLYDWNDSYPWSKTSDGPTHERIRRVRDWIEVEDALALLALEPSA